MRADFGKTRSEFQTIVNTCKIFPSAAPPVATVPLVPTYFTKEATWTMELIEELWSNAFSSHETSEMKIHIQVNLRPIKFSQDSFVRNECRTRCTNQISGSFPRSAIAKPITKNRNDTENDNWTS